MYVFVEELITQVFNTNKPTDSHYATPFPSAASLLPIHLEEYKISPKAILDNCRFLVDLTFDVVIVWTVVVSNLNLPATPTVFGFSMMLKNILRSSRKTIRCHNGLDI